MSEKTQIQERIKAFTFVKKISDMNKTIEHFKQLTNKLVSKSDYNCLGGNLDLYVKEAKSQLLCNEGKSGSIAYLYTNEEVDAHLHYFEAAMNAGLSSYKALLFFHDYLQELT